MASIKGVSLKKMKRTIGREGYGLLADVYVNNKKIGEYEDFGDGAMGDIHYTSTEAEEQFMHIVFAYSKEHPSDCIVEMYKKDPERYEAERERILKYQPYIKEEEITIESVSAAHLDIIIADVEALTNAEKEFKKILKKGYKCLVIAEQKHQQYYYYYGDATDEQIKKNHEKVIAIYRSLDDFKIA